MTKGLINTTVRPIHFEDFGGVEFERLVFAYHLRAGWADLHWYGKTGSDLGRDIIGTELSDDTPDRRTVIQCVNRASLTLAKAKKDMTNAVKAEGDKLKFFKFVCRSDVSSEQRTKIQTAGQALGLTSVTIWPGAEFEEHLRLRAESLLRRFIEGVPFPDAEADLTRFVDDFPDLSDQEALELMAATFDRPAFHAPFQGESSLPAFQRALEDTIRALNTGLWQSRENHEIRRIPSLNNLKSPALQKTVRQVVRELDEVRHVFKARLADGTVQHCGCDDPHCPVFQVTPAAAAELDQARAKVLATFKSIYPPFDVRLHDDASRF